MNNLRLRPDRHPVTPDDRNTNSVIRDSETKSNQVFVEVRCRGEDEDEMILGAGVRGG
jgi:hypothetical protein